MPWCPKCKSEYRDGFKICTDCNIELVESLTSKKLSLLASFTEKNIAEKFNAYLAYSKIYSEIIEENDFSKVMVEKDAFKECIKALNAYIKVEGNLIATKNIDSSYTVSSQEELYNEFEELKKHFSSSDNDNSDNDSVIDEYDFEEDTDSDEEIDLSSAFSPRDSVIYTSKETKAEENYGTGIMLICAGIILVAFTVIGSDINQILSFSGIMKLVLSLIMIIYGIYSIKHSKTLLAEASEENKLVEDINNWLKSNVLKDEIISQDVIGESFETNYFKRIAFIKNRLMKEFPELEDNFADEMIEKFYDEIIEE